MSRLNLIEQECQDVLVAARDILAAPHSLEHGVYTELMGRIRMALVHLTNKEFGCPTGKHAGSCACKGGFDDGLAS